jgi:hypothetical protein
MMIPEGLRNGRRRLESGTRDLSGLAAYMHIDHSKKA